MTSLGLLLSNTLNFTYGYKPLFKLVKELSSLPLSLRCKVTTIFYSLQIF